MSTNTFRALVVEELDEGRFSRRIGTKSIDDLPKGDVLIKVHFSSLNYKDALSAIGNKGVTRKYPHTPGIDAAGEVAAGTDERFPVGSRVLVTGYDLGMNTAGGFGQYIRVPADWVVPLPSGLSLRESMTYGTAGFTAGLGVSKLTRAGITPDMGDVLVTGASGGVGSLAVAILAHLGYPVVAASGKPEAREFLTRLGARRIIGREEVTDDTRKPLLPQRWAAAIDTVGGPVLAYVLRATDRHGVVACCGNVASARLDLTVYPFILRGITLSGIDSATTQMERRLEIWKKLAGEWKPAPLGSIASILSLDELSAQIDVILAGGQMGRRVLDMEA